MEANEFIMVPAGKRTPNGRSEVHFMVDQDISADFLKRKWNLQSNGKIVTNQPTRYTQAERVIYNEKAGVTLTKGQTIKLINKNPLDLRFANMKLVSMTELQRSRHMRKSNMIGYKGVTKRGDKYRAQIKVAEGTVSLPQFETPEKAGRSYQLAYEIIFPGQERKEEPISLDKNSESEIVAKVLATLRQCNFINLK